jgi:hypothetical protein
VLRVAALAALSLLLPLAACGGADTSSDESGTAARQTTAAEKPEEPPAPAQATCPAGSANCRSASGRIIYVEAVDPDGDGDAHFVLLSGDNVTGPGISVIDVARDLRPHPLPGIGDEVSAAGPVYTGSYGQRQIQAEELHVARR